MNGVPIKREDIRKGDRIRVSYEFVDGETGSDNFTYELIERPVVLPTITGIYEDVEGNLWRLHTMPGDEPQAWTLDGDPMTDNIARQYAPFTLLRPVAEVAAEVIADILKLILPESFIHAGITQIAEEWATK